MSRMLAATVLLSAVPALASAQASALVGKWAIEYPGATRNENGEITQISVKGKLTIESVGDSLVGTLTPDSMPGAPVRPPTRLAAKGSDGNVVFVTRQEAKLNMNGEEQTRVAVVTWTFTAKGDELTGSVNREIEGIEIQMGGMQPVKGTRIKV